MVVNTIVFLFWTTLPSLGKAVYLCIAVWNYLSGVTTCHHFPYFHKFPAHFLKDQVGVVYPWFKLMNRLII